MAPHLPKIAQKSLNKIMKDLRKNFPPAYPVKIRTRTKMKDLGYTYFIDGKKPYFVDLENYKDPSDLGKKAFLAVKRLAPKINSELDLLKLRIKCSR